MLKRALLALAALSMLSAACGGGSAFGDEAVVVWANRDLAVGRERLLVAVVAENGVRLASPDKPATLEVAPADDPSAAQSKEAGFTWSVPDSVGFYRAVFDFDRPGVWELTVRDDGGAALDTVLIQVRDDGCRQPGSSAPCSPRVGEQAPRLATPSLADARIGELTTDFDPDPRLHQLSLDDMLANGRTGVIVFATPAFCQTATCGPVIETIKPVIDRHPAVDFLHLEIYTGLLDDDFVPDAAHVAPAVRAWTLSSEPWVFVVDGSGVIIARFEGAVAAEELETHL